MLAKRKDAPVALVEDEATGDRFLLYSTNQGVRVELRFEGETLWASEQQISELFGVTRQNVNLHLNNVYNEGELDRAATCKEILQVRLEGRRSVQRGVAIHNLNAIISVGYRVSSKQGTLFRIWATDTLVQFATKGFVVDTRRLKNPDEHDRVRELREIIRDIRSDEANLYREVRRICSMCQDYDAKSPDWRNFYTHMQAKLMWAVTSHTPAMIIAIRASADAANLGLQSWPKDEIRQQDALVAKNYLGQSEVRELNRVTSILLDIFEDQLDIGKLTMMAEAETLLDGQLRSLNRAVLSHGGTVKSTEAERHAKDQYRTFDERRRALRHVRADAGLVELIESQQTLARPVRKKKKPAADG